MNKEQAQIGRIWRRRSRDCKIDDLKAIADWFGIGYRQPGGSHVYFHAANGKKLAIPAHRPVKPVYVREFIALVDSLKEIR